MYLIGFLLSYLLVRYQIKKRKLSITEDTVEQFYFYIILGLIAGARVGYIIFYNLDFYIRNPLDMFAVWHGGMSFHGGLIGVIVAAIIFSKRYKLDFFMLSDLVVVTAPVGLGLGRIGNFINGELYGRVTTVPWAMVFPSGGPLPRHPSQLYEFLLEGVLLFIVLWRLKNRGFKSGIISGLFLILYGVFRFIAEFFREPDPQLGFVIGPFTMGQMLSSVMVIGGIFLLLIRSRRVTK